jgi:hypothetical protein
MLFLPLFVILNTLLRHLLSKSFNETLTPWEEPNCILSNATDFSPINIKTRLVECDPNIFLDITFNISAAQTTGEMDLGDDPQTVKSQYPPNFLKAFIKTSNQTIVQFDAIEGTFRYPAEHRVNFVRHALEWQIRFDRNSLSPDRIQREKIFLSLMFEMVDNEETTTKFFLDYLEYMKNENINVLKASVPDTPLRYQINDVETFNELIERPIQFYYYNGSRTDNDCESGYQWYVMKQKFKIRRADLVDYSDLIFNITNYGQNARFMTESTYEPSVYIGGEECEDFFLNFLWFIIFYTGVNYFVFKIL